MSAPGYYFFGMTEQRSRNRHRWWWAKMLLASAALVTFMLSLVWVSRAWAAHSYRHEMMWERWDTGPACGPYDPEDNANEVQGPLVSWGLDGEVASGGELLCFIEGFYRDQFCSVWQ